MVDRTERTPLKPESPDARCGKRSPELFGHGSAVTACRPSVMTPDATRKGAQMTTDNRLTRATPADLEIRSDGRTVVGICVPFDSPTEIRDMSGSYTETFQRGAFTRTIAERGDRVKFLAHHDRRAMPLGRAVLLREDNGGLYGEFRVSQTAAGDEALELIRDGALDGLSIGFEPVASRDQWSRDRSSVVRTEVKLHEVSAVSFPAFSDALISGVRAAEAPKVIDLAAARLRLELLKNW